MRASPPRTEAELLERSESLAGLSLGEIAAAWRVPVPRRSRSAKGFAGTLLETVLGATAASRPEPDFQLICVELKTLPIDDQGKPRESTYVCTVPLVEHHGLTWERSPVKRKLDRVLWIPIVTSRDTPVADRVVATPLLWSPSAEEEAALKRDFEELMDMVVMGELHRLTAHHGNWLQIRPKAADARSRSRASAADGAPSATLPRGFYLRALFTERVLRQHYAMP